MNSRVSRSASRRIGSAGTRDDSYFLQPADRPKIGVAISAPSGTDDTATIQSALTLAESSGIGHVWLEGGEYLASQLSIPRFVVLEGMGIGSTSLKQISGSNQDFIVSENFATLTGTGATVTGNVNVPSFFGLRNLRVDGNKANQTAGRGIAFYGPALILDMVLVHDCFGDNIYTEYSPSIGSTGWQSQEEGLCGTVISRDSGGTGWLFRGPHNSIIGAYLGLYNGEWGFYSEVSELFDGNLDKLGHIHTYANGRNYTPHGDMGQHFGAIARVGTCITDGDNLELAAAQIQIQTWRAANLGGQRDGLVVTGNNCHIGDVNAVVWSSSTGRKAIDVQGERFTIGSGSLTSDNGDNDGLVVTGNDCDINLFIQGFSGTGRKGIDYSASRGNIRGKVVGCATGFNYTAGANNKIDLEITTNTGQLAVAGSSPASSDTFDIHASGTGQVGRTRNFTGTSPAASNQVDLTVTTVQTLTIAHGLLYVPSDVAAWLQTSTAVDDYAVDFIRYEPTLSGATNAVFKVKLGTASATAGAKANLRILASIDGS